MTQLDAKRVGGFPSRHQGEVDSGIYGRTDRDWWVRASEYDALLATISDLKAEMAELRNAIKTVGGEELVLIIDIVLGKAALHPQGERGKS